VPGYDTTHSVPSPWLPAVSFDLPMETAGKRAHRLAAAGHLSESARLNLATVAWQVRSHLRSSLVDLAAAQQRDALLQEQVSFQEQIVERLDQQVQAGAIASSETAPFRVALQKLRLDRAEAQSRRVEARVRVAEALGVPAGALDVAQLSVDLLTLPHTAADLTSAEIRRAALQNRTDILGALSEYAAAQATLQLEIAKQYPDVHLNPGYQFDMGDNKWSLGITFELPVLNQNQGPIAEAVARRTETAARFNALQAGVLAEIERTVEVFRIAEKNAVTLTALAETQARRRDSVEAQLRAGATDQLDLLNAQAESAASQLVRLEGQAKLQQAVGAMEDAVQRPLDADTAPPGTVLGPENPSAARVTAARETQP
jgi:outer membrane protein TolC